MKLTLAGRKAVKDSIKHLKSNVVKLKKWNGNGWKIYYVKNYI